MISFLVACLGAGFIGASLEGDLWANSSEKRHTKQALFGIGLLAFGILFQVHG